MPINNTIGNISVAKADLPQSKFDFSCTLHSTLQFGEVVAGYFDFMKPGDKRTVKSSERLLAAPLLAPVFGKAKLKGIHQFVPVKALTRNFDPMLSQESINRGTTSFVCTSVPNMTLRDLSIFMLWGAKCTVYEGDGSLGNDPDDNTLTLYKYSGFTGSLTSSDPGFSFATVAGINNFAYSNYGLNNAGNLRVGRLLDDYPNVGSYLTVPLSNPTNGSFYDVDPSCPFYTQDSAMFDLDTVPIDKADAVVPLFYSSGGNDYAMFYAFRFSSFGKRIKKILNVLGYQFNLNSSVQVSLLPFMAFFKAYYDMYAPKLFSNWEESFCYRMTQICDLSASPNVMDFWKGTYGSLTDIQQAIMDFMILEFGATFYTEEQNFWSAHTRNTSVSPSANSFIGDIGTDVDMTRTPNITSVNTTSQTASIVAYAGHAFINDTIHGQLDSNLLERLYRWTNKNTLAGRRIGELLRMQYGYNPHDDEPDYIGQFEVPLNVYDMLSSADTYSKAADSGAPLGERAGNGQAQSQEKPFTYESSEYGFWVTLLCVVPEGTFTETVAPHALAIHKFDFYTPDFDSLGYEFDSKLLLQGSMPFADFVSSDGSLDDSFGLAPRYFRWKFGRSVQTGDFTLRSVRDGVSPYSLEKYVNVGERVSYQLTDTSSSSTWRLHKMFKPKDLPIAGDVWRYITRYPFIGHFNRIFNYSTGTYERWYRSIGTSQAEYEYFSWMADNFILHVYFDVDNRSKMLPVSRSFETDDDGKVDATIGKA